MWVNNLPKVATQWNSGATRESNRAHRARIPSVLTTKPLSHTSLTNCTDLSACGTRRHQRKTSAVFNQPICRRRHQTDASSSKRMTNRQRSTPRVDLLHRQRPKLDAQHNKSANKRCILKDLHTLLDTWGSYKYQQWHTVCSQVTSKGMDYLR